MPLTLELPAQLEEDLRHEAQKEGVPATERATLLLSILTALLREARITPFQDALETFLSQHSLDAKLVASVFEELVRECLEAHDEGKTSYESQESWSDAVSLRVYENLRAWRNGQVHQPIDESIDEVVFPFSPLSQPVQRPGRMMGEQSAMGKYAHIPGTSEDFAREKQKEIAREDKSTG